MASKSTKSSKAVKKAKRARRRARSLQVSGQVADRETGQGLPGLRVEVIHAVPGDEKSLGFAVTDDRGIYEYTFTADALGKAEKEGPALRMRVFGSTGIMLGESEITRRASERSAIDVRVAPSEARLTEYEQLLGEISPGRRGDTLADLDSKGIAALAQQIGRERRSIELLVESARLAREIRLPMEVLYALGREGIQLTASGLAAISSDRVKAALENGAKLGTVPAGVSDLAGAAAARLESIRADRAPLSDVAGPTHAGMSAALGAFLGERGVRTLADVRSSAGLTDLKDLPAAADEQTLRRLAAHAQLNLLASGPETNAKLIEAGYTTLSGIANVSSGDFVDSLRGSIEADQAKELHAIATAQTSLLNNMITGLRVSSGGTVQAQYSAVIAPTCGCESCQDAASPMAYLADLLDYTLRHLKNNGTAVTLTFLQDRFHQPFRDLPATCEVQEKRVRQVRICIEVLREHLPAPFDTATPQSYLEGAYVRLLQAIGTSLEEVRRMRAIKDPGERQAVAARLGIELRRQRALPNDPDEIDQLFLDTDRNSPANPGWPRKLSEEQLEQLFGLRDTHRPPLDPDVFPEVLGWRMRYLRSRWQAEDGATSGPLGEYPIIDPDYVGFADLKDTTQNPTPRSARNRITWSVLDFLEDRRTWLATTLAELDQTRRATSLTQLLDLLQTNLYFVGTTGMNGITVPVLLDLRQKKQGGSDIGPLLQPLRLDEDTFEYLSYIAELDQNGDPILDSEWADFYSILVGRIKKYVMYPIWRAEEVRDPLNRNSRITLSSDYFRIRPAAFSGGQLEWTLERWRTSAQVRETWDTTLRARIEQEEAVIGALRAAVDATEEALLAGLRDQLRIDAGMWGTPRLPTANALTGYLEIDTQAEACQITTRVAQAIETLQGLLFGSRNGLLEDDALILDAADFDEEWQWIGSYAAWRSAMLVFLYPENALRPTLRSLQSQPFKDFLTGCRAFSKQMTAADADALARTYAEYFKDVCSLHFEAVCGSYYPPAQDAPLERMELSGTYFLIVARADSGTLYYCLQDTQPYWWLSSGFRRTVWNPIPGMERGAQVRSIFPVVSPAGWTIGLHVEVPQPGSESKAYTFSFDGDVWSKGIEGKLPALFCSAIIEDARLRSAPGGTAGAALEWRLSSLDRTVLMDVDGDGRKELILIADNTEPDQTRRIGLVREQNGGLVLDRVGFLPQGWRVPSGEPVVLRMQLVQSPARRREGLLLVRTAGATADFGVAGLAASGVFGLVASTTGGTIANASGQNPWTIEPGPRFQSVDLDGDGYSELVVLGAEFSVTDFRGTITIIQNVTVLRVRETGFTLISTGSTQPVQTWAAVPDSQSVGRSVLVVQRTGRVYPTGALQSPLVRIWSTTALAQRGPSESSAMLQPSAAPPLGFEDPKSGAAVFWGFQRGDRFLPLDFDGVSAGYEILLTNGSRSDTAIMVLEPPPPVAVAAPGGKNPPPDSSFGLTWRTAGRIDPSNVTSGQTWQRQTGDRMIAADVDGDGNQEILILAPDDRRIAVLGRGAAGALEVRQSNEIGLGGPIRGSAPLWPLAKAARYLAGDIDGDGCDEILAFAPGGPIGILRGGAALKSAYDLGMRDSFGPSSVQARTVIPLNSPLWSAERPAQIQAAYESNMYFAGDPDVFYLDEAYYFVPMELGLRLRESGDYTGALDWFRSDYDYARPPEHRKNCYKLVLDAGDPDYQRSRDWLQDPLNPHAIAETRKNSYTKFTILAIVRCLLDFADAEFTRATSESIPRARELYLTALELLDSEELRQHEQECSDLIGRLRIQVGDDEEIWTWYEIREALRKVGKAKQLATVVEELQELLPTGEDRRARLEQARRITAQTLEVAQGAEIPTLVTVTTERAPALQAASAAILSDSAAAEAVAYLGGGASGVGQRAYASSPGELASSSAAATADDGVPVSIVEIGKKGRVQYVPAPSLAFCIPFNPVVQAARSHAELCLHKLRACRNIAGMELRLEPYAAPTAAQPNLQTLGDGDQLPARPALNLQPLPYRYSVLIERTKQLVELARQMEGSMLSFLASADQEKYQEIKARQDLALTQAGLRLKDIQLIQADDGVVNARLQRERAQLQAGHFTGLLDAGWSENEELQMANLVIADLHQHATAISAWVEAFMSPTGSITSAISASGSAWGMNVQIHALLASFERREEEWRFQEDLAQQDVRIGEQQIRLAQDQVRVATQERAISGLQVEHAGQILDFLTIKKFTNYDLYEWMSGAMEQVYRFFLQQATSMAQVAEQQLSFERQEILSTFIQADYWEAPASRQSTDFSLPGAQGTATSTRGLTGSARLLRDVYELDQYAFLKNQRKLQLTETLSLAQLDPFAFQRFRQTGVLQFSTPMSLFDRKFPGHYLRLIKRVRTSVIALVPPAQGIRATLSTTGTSRVVIGNGPFDRVTIQRGPESTALSSPVNASGLFDLDAQPELLVPFEGIGVDATWEFSMPKASNLFNYDTIADVLVTIDYTALNSFDYQQQVLMALDRRVSADRPFSFRRELSDQWYDLHNAELLDEPDRMVVRFRTELSDFPPNIQDLTVRHVVLHFTGQIAAIADIEDVDLQFTSDLGGAGGGAAQPVNGHVSTRTGAWNSLIGQRLPGEWVLSLRPLATDPNRVQKLGALTELFKADKQAERIQDIHLVVTFGGTLPAWPA
jgi:hypothetical protein